MEMMTTMMIFASTLYQNLNNSPVLFQNKATSSFSIQANTVPSSASQQGLKAS